MAAMERAWFTRVRTLASCTGMVSPIRFTMPRPAWWTQATGASRPVGTCRKMQYRASIWSNSCATITAPRTRSPSLSATMMDPRAISSCRRQTRRGRPTTHGAETTAKSVPTCTATPAAGPTTPIFQQPSTIPSRIEPMLSATIGRSSSAPAAVRPRARRTTCSAPITLRSTGWKRTATMSLTFQAWTLIGSAQTL